MQPRFFVYLLNGIGAPASRHGDRRRTQVSWTERIPLSDHLRKSTTYSWHGSGVVDGPIDRELNRRIELPPYLRSMSNKLADIPMPGCRTPLPSKGKQKVGAVSYVGAILTTTRRESASFCAVWCGCAPRRILRMSVNGRASLSPPRIPFLG